VSALEAALRLAGRAEVPFGQGRIVFEPAYAASHRSGALPMEFYVTTDRKRVRSLQRHLTRCFKRVFPNEALGEFWCSFRAGGFYRGPAAYTGPGARVRPSLAVAFYEELALR